MKKQRLFMEEDTKIHKSRRSYKLTIPKSVICGAYWAKIIQEDNYKLPVKIRYDFDTGNIIIRNPKTKKIISIPEYFDIVAKVGKRKFNKKEFFEMKQNFSKIYSIPEVESLFIKSGYISPKINQKLKINNKKEEIKYLEKQIFIFGKAINSYKKMIKSIKSKKN